MKRTPFLVLIILCICAPLGVAAQDAVIDLFDNQESMAAGSLTIDGADGPSAEDLGLGGSIPGQLTLKFQRSDRSLLVETQIEGKGAYMLFDTGASLTAIDAAYLESRGLLPGDDAPKTMVSTANGQVPASFGILSSLKVGDRVHSGVSFLTCASCPSGTFKGKPIVGLLGLNVLNRYKYSIDESAGTIELTPTSAFNNRMRDIEPWVQVKRGAGQPTPDGRTIVVFEVENQSKRDVKEMVFEVQCSTGKSGKLKPLRLPAKKTTSVEQKVAIEKCGAASIRALGGRW